MRLIPARIVYLLGTLTACSSSAPAPVLPPPNPPGPTANSTTTSTQSPPGAFPELTSLVESGASAQIFRLYHRQQYSEARSLAQSALSASAGEEARTIRVLLAHIEHKLAHWDAAAALFAQSATEQPAMADYLNFMAAGAFARGGNGAQSRTQAQLVHPQSPWANAREFLLAESLRAGGMWDRALPHYQAYLGGNPADPELAAQASFRLGESFRELGDSDAAMTTWRQLLIVNPLSPWAQQIPALAPKLRTLQLSGKEHLTRGMAYFHAMRNPAAIRDLQAALRSTLTAEERCQALFHRAKSVYKERKYQRAAPLFVPAIAACKASGNTNFEVKSAYQAGLAYGRAGKHQVAARHFAYIEKYPDHSYADDSRLRQAEQYLALGRDKKVTSLLSSIPGLYPNGDMRGEAMWRLARRAFHRKQYGEAADWLRKQIATVPIEINWWAEGQAQYWLARSVGELGRTNEAIAAYQNCIALYPMTYYSLQAFNRLRDSWPDKFAESLATVRAAPATWRFPLKPRPQYATEAFQSALALAQHGLAEPARRQLAVLGFTVPQGRKQVTDPEELDKLIATSLLLDLAKDATNSHWIGRWHALDYRRTWPHIPASGESGDQRLWRTAYPLAFWSLLQEFAAKYQYPPHLQMAIVREESAFDPSRESYANAVGLTQMIFPTAIDHSRGTGIAVTRENLQHPVKNVTIGSHFLQSLQAAFEGEVGLMVPGYNAGRARVRSWIRQRHKLALDEFIEQIPGDQARRYTKRVLGSYFTYHYLDTQQVPAIGNTVPRRLGTLRRR